MVFRLCGNMGGDMGGDIFSEVWVYKYKKALWMCVFLFVFGCKTQHNQLTYEESNASELSLVKDSFYYLLLGDPGPNAQGEEMRAFYVCHVFGEEAPVNPESSKYCVNAFATHEGAATTVSIAKKDLVDTRDLRQEVGFSNAATGHERKGFVQIIALVAGGSAVAAALGAGMGYVAGGSTTIATLGVVLGMAATPIGYQVMASKNEAMKDSHLNKNPAEAMKHSPEFRKAFSEGLEKYGKEFHKHEELQQLLKDYNIQNPASRMQLVIMGSARADIGKAFARFDANSASNENISFVKTKIPDMLPLLADMVNKFYKFGGKGVPIAMHCLPKRDYESQNPRMCLPLSQKWDTGSFVHYAKPKDRN